MDTKINQKQTLNRSNIMVVRILLAALLVGVFLCSAYSLGVNDQKTNERQFLKESLILLDANNSVDQLTQEGIKKALSLLVNTAEILSVKDAELPGWYEIISNDQIMYLSHDKRFVMTGEVVDLEKRINITLVTKAKRIMANSFLQSSLDHNATFAPNNINNKRLAPVTFKEISSSEVVKNNIYNTEKTLIPSPLKAIKEEKPKTKSLKFTKDDMAALQQNLREKINAELHSGEGMAISQPDTSERGVNKIPKIGYSSDGNKLSAVDKRNKVSNAFNSLDKNYTINYPAVDKEIGTLVVFSDYTCPVCARFHNRIPEFNNNGISVRYLMYPRAMALGDTSASRSVAENMRRAWCAPNQQDALDDLYRNKRIKNYNCEDLPEGVVRSKNPIKEHYILGEIFELKGTPHSFTDTGIIIEGYLNMQNTIDRMGLDITL